jgi:hypothetical protein
VLLCIYYVILLYIIGLLAGRFLILNNDKNKLFKDLNHLFLKKIFESYAVNFMVENMGNGFGVVIKYTVFIINHWIILSYKIMI